MLRSTARSAIDRRPRRAGAWLAGVCFALVVAGCAPSADDVKEEFDEFLSTRNRCTSVDDCVLVSPGCPIGCQVGVNKAYAAEVKAKAEELVEDYESGGQSCAYDCIAAEPACEGGRCQAVPLD
jgi:hypothetical protein